MKLPEELGVAGKIAHAFINSKLTPLIIGAALLAGAFSIWRLPREEEPQIIVPMIDVFVQMPGASAKEVEERVTKPMEKLLWEVPGVEYIYSTSKPGQSLVIVRFYVGENEEHAIVRLNQKLFSNFDRIPPGASRPLVKPRYIDDVPILALTLWGDGYNSFQLRQLAGQLHDEIKRVDDVSEVKIIGGQRRQLRVTLNAAKLEAYSVTPLQVMGAVGMSNQRLPSGEYANQNREFILETGDFIRSAEDARRVVVGVAHNKPIFLKDVAEVQDTGEVPTQYVTYSQGPRFYPAVTISVAKRKGTNAVDVVNRIFQRMDQLKGTLIPAGVHVTATRNYGATAEEKSNELLFHMAIAVVSVSILIWLTLGWRESWIVFVAIPVTLALTLTTFFLYGYTLNRITLFALIFSIGILVDDAIVVVENIVRHRHLPSNKGRPLSEVAVEAVDEVGNPTILATFTVIAAILPMAFVTGLMGPYMRPIPVGASGAMLFSLAIAFIVTPWATIRILGKKSRLEEEIEHEEKPDRLKRFYWRLMNGLLHRPVATWTFLVGLVVLLLVACSLVYIQFVKVKMLPFDNKSEFQVVVDMPEGTTLEQTARVTRELAEVVKRQPEVINVVTYAGTASPYNFNGLVRHYFLRRGPNVADIQVNLTPKGERKRQSHEIAKAVRRALQPVAEKWDANVKVAEVPPGPPVLSTLVAEVYGPTQAGQIRLARRIRKMFEDIRGVVDVDWFVEADQPKYKLLVDEEKASLNGITDAQIAKTIALASAGQAAGLMHVDNAQEPIPIMVRLDRATRSDAQRILDLKIRGRTGRLVPLRELVHPKLVVEDKSIYHKNLMPVTYVIGDVAGAIESPVYAILPMMKEIDQMKIPEGYRIEQYTAHQPKDSSRYAIKWDGEWHITYEVFRDLGIAFGAVLILIYVLVVGWFQSYTTPLVIMSVIPFSLIGILPAHGVLHAFFTATSMIGFIAGAGIVVRNSIILIDFVELRLREGEPLDEAVIEAGAVRFRPIALTAAAVAVAATVILFDPIFQGLAIALMAGELTALAMTPIAMPVIYYLVNRRKYAV